MARIPIYQSRIDPRVGTSLDLPRAGAESFGGGFGQSLERLGAGMTARDERRRRADEEAQENAALTAAARSVEEVNAASDKARAEARANAAADGAGHAEAVLEDFDQRQNAVLAGITNEKARNWAERQFIRRRGDLDVQESAWATGLRATAVVGDYAQSRDIAANGLFTAPDRRSLDSAMEAHGELIDGLRIPADAKAKLKTETRQIFGASYARGLAERDPHALRAEIDSGALNDVLAPDAIATLRNRADTEIRSIETARRVEARAAESARREAEREVRATMRENLGGIMAALQAGVPVPMETVTAAASMAAQLGNQGQAVTIATLGTKAAVNRSFGQMSPIELQREEQALSARIAKAGANASPTDIAARDQLRTLRAEQKKGASGDLLGWEARYGAEIPALDPADPATFQQRGEIARSAARKYNVPVQPLTSTEADAYAERLSSGTPAQKAAVARELAAFGRDARAAASQIAERDPLAGHAVGLAAMGRIGTATELFAGAEFLRGTPKIAPKMGVDERFEQLIGGALRFMPKGRETIKEAATNIYAARWGKSGGTEWRAPAFDAGVRMALGAITGADGIERGGLGNWRGEPVVLPRGVSQDEFEQQIAGLTDEGLRSAPEARPVDDRGNDVPASRIRSAQLFSEGDGIYLVQLRGASAPLRAANGDLFRLYMRSRSAP
ncbi:MAG: hypothetical protein WDA25_00960 [Paracoccaceae bacterium]